MRKYTLTIAAVLALLVAGTAYATTGYWTKPTSCGQFPCVKALYPAVAGAPNDRQPDGGIIGNNWDPDAGVNSSITGLGPQSGFGLANLKGFVVTVETLNGAVDGGVFSAGTLQAYVYSHAAARWSRAPDLDLTVVSGLASQSFYGFTVTASMGRVAFVPSGLGQPVNVYISGER